MQLDDSKDTVFRYRIPNSGQILELSDPVIEIFKFYRQTGGKPEAGGLLFAELCLPRIIIKQATTPHKLDKRSKFSFIPYRKPQKDIISQFFNTDLHFVGEWHTHFQRNPSPSIIDLHSMQDSFLKSKHELNAFIMIIVGSYTPGLRLWISLHNENGFQRL